MTTKTYTFRTNPLDPAPLVMTLQDWFARMPVSRTTQCCFDELKRWMSEDELPTYNALYNSLARSPYLKRLAGNPVRWVDKDDDSD